MGLIPGGSQGFAKRVMDDMGSSAAKIAVAGCALLAMGGIYVFFLDLRASALGWGSWVSQNVGGDEWMMTMAILVSAIPQVIQTTLGALYAADNQFFKPVLFKIMYAGSFLLDSFLDWYYLTSAGANPLVAAGIVFGVFGMLSELLISVFGALTLALAKEAFKRKVQPNLPAFMGWPPPSRGARPSAGPRPSQHRPGRGAPAPVPVDVEELLGKAGGRR